MVKILIADRYLVTTGMGYTLQDYKLEEKEVDGVMVQVEKLSNPIYPSNWQQIGKRIMERMIDDKLKSVNIVKIRSYVEICQQTHEEVKQLFSKIDFEFKDAPKR